MNKSLFQKEVVPFFLMFALLMVATIIMDFLLHQFQLVWLGRYLGIPGTLFILLSFLYSLRKRKMIHVGNPKLWLNLHGFLTWAGTLMILVHAGVHFNAILPWLAVIAMLVNVISGLTGKFLLNRSQRYLSSKKANLVQQGFSNKGIEKEIFWDAVTLDLMNKWRAVHFPITLVFIVLSLSHIISIFLFWEWK
ncbi:MAG: hypothetical protein DRR08_30355 [Candidatus Parabeggiatoa sp. nov. 2]|nr:MAG: hypothetical protein B6247_23000 [Beggiatoa sp. 4572_84]RKZ50385.1 MAG: hypothetical protein DRR08_30355 [Gammaproteobacteria bacterium]